MKVTSKRLLDEIFYCDGSLRDLYILNTDVSVWVKFLECIQSGKWKYRFIKNGTEVEYKDIDASYLLKKSEMMSH